MKKGDKFFDHAILNLDGLRPELDLYFVFFYEEKEPVTCRASSFTEAEILACAVRILDGKSYGVDRVLNDRTKAYVPSCIKTF